MAAYLPITATKIPRPCNQVLIATINIQHKVVELNNRHLSHSLNLWIGQIISASFRVLYVCLYLNSLEKTFRQLSLVQLYNVHKPQLLCLNQPLRKSWFSREMLKVSQNSNIVIKSLFKKTNQDHKYCIQIASRVRKLQ